MTNLDWYNTKKLHSGSDNIAYAFVTGARRIGKTDYFLKEICDNYQKDGSQAVWVRDYDKVFNKKFCNTFLTDAKLFGWCPPEWYCKPEDGVYTAEKDGERVVWFQGLNTFSNSRGGSTPDVSLIHVDEFMNEQRRYPTEPAKAIKSIVKTYTSQREDAICYLSSNFISSANPYFAHWRIYPERGNDVTYFKNGSVAIEVCRGYKTAFPPNNKWAMAEEGITNDYESPEEDALFNLIMSTKKGERWHVFIQSNKLVYKAVFHNNLVYFSPMTDKLPNNAYIMTPNLTEMDGKVKFISPWVRKAVKDWHELGMIRFNDPNTMFDILSIVFNEI